MIRYLLSIEIEIILVFCQKKNLLTLPKNFFYLFISSRIKTDNNEVFFYGRGNENRQLGTGFIVDHRIVSAVKRVDFVSDRVSYIVLRGRWCNVTVLNMHAPSEEKSGFPLSKAR